MEVQRLASGTTYNTTTPKASAESAGSAGSAGSTGGYSGSEAVLSMLTAAALGVGDPDVSIVWLVP